jgi:hypothetical protein
MYLIHFIQGTVKSEISFSLSSCIMPIYTLGIGFMMAANRPKYVADLIGE